MRGSGSSSISSRTSRSSSTSEALSSRRPLAARLLAILRLVHPFPSAVDAVATVAIALVAGAGGIRSLELATGMLGLQFAIGTANDLVDAPTDAIAQPAKPLARGLLSRREAQAILAVSLAAGLVAAALAGPTALVVALGGLGLGFLYDFRLKGTPLSWLALAGGVGLLPVYAWSGASGRLPPAFLAVVALAVLGGATLAFGNALADLERDRRAGVASVATRLGRRRTLMVSIGLLAALHAITLGTSFLLPGLPPVALAAELAGATTGWLGLRLGASPAPAARRLGWEVQAVALTVLGAAWIAGLSAAGALAGG